MKLILKSMACIALLVPHVHSQAETSHKIKFPPLSGYLGLEGRFFQNERLFTEQFTQDSSLALFAETFISLSDQQRFTVSAFGRYDNKDKHRTHADFREAYWSYVTESNEIHLGVRKLFWGVAESAHLVDVINQTDIVENIDGEDKLGQPLLHWVSNQDWGALDFIIMPYFREQSFPSKKGRLRLPFTISSKAQYQSSQAEKHIDTAIRWSHYFGPVDIALSHFSGTNRHPIFIPPENLLSDEWTPYYSLLQQTGVELQATIDAWLLKLEAISVKPKSNDRYSATVLGLEYSYYSVFNSNADLGLIIEYQFDDRGSKASNSSAFQNDFVGGLRLGFNDLDNSEILFLASHDLDNQSQFYSLELKRRINDQWKIEAQLRVFSRGNTDMTGLYLSNEDYGLLELKRFF